MWEFPAGHLSCRSRFVRLRKIKVDRLGNAFQINVSFLLKSVKLVCGPFGQSNMKVTLNFCPDKLGRNLNEQKLKIS